MHGPFLGPQAYLALVALDDAEVDAVAPRRPYHLGKLSEQMAIPLLAPLGAGRALGQPAAQDLERRGKRPSPRVQPRGGGGFLPQHPYPEVPPQQAIDFLHHARGRRAAPWRPFALIGFDLIEG